jgi:hypothetical protein
LEFDYSVYSYKKAEHMAGGLAGLRNPREVRRREAFGGT